MKRDSLTVGYKQGWSGLWRVARNWRHPERGERTFFPRMGLDVLEQSHRVQVGIGLPRIRILLNDS